MSVSGNIGHVSFPETLRRESVASTSRVKQHRARRSMIRVEVEVPTRDDALKVRRFAQRRRQAGGYPGRDGASREPNCEDLAALLARMPAASVPALHVFASALLHATSPELLHRAERVAATFADAVQRDESARLTAD